MPDAPASTAADRIADESIPPDRNRPTGTSATRCAATACWTAAPARARSSGSAEPDTGRAYTPATSANGCVVRPPSSVQRVHVPGARLSTPATYVSEGGTVPHDRNPSTPAGSIVRPASPDVRSA